MPGIDTISDVGGNPRNERWPGILIAPVEGALLYLNAEHVCREPPRRIEQERPVSPVVFDLSGSPGTDLAGVHLLAELATYFEARGTACRLAEACGERELYRIGEPCDGHQQGIAKSALSDL